MSEVTSRRLAVVMSATALMLVVYSSCFASWHVVGYDPAGPVYVDTPEPDVGWTQIKQGDVVVGRYMRTANPNYACAWVEIWYPAGAPPDFEVQKTLSASARDEGQVFLQIAGSAPPSSPQAWNQKCHASATWQFQLDQAENTGPDWEVDFDAYVYAKNAAIATHEFKVLVEEDGNYGSKSGTFSSDTPTWASLPCSRWYTATYISANSAVKALTLNQGSLSASVTVNNMNWYAEYQ